MDSMLQVNEELHQLPVYSQPVKKGRNFPFIPLTTLVDWDLKHKARRAWGRGYGKAWPVNLTKVVSLVTSVFSLVATEGVCVCAEVVSHFHFPGGQGEYYCCSP